MTREDEIDCDEMLSYAEKTLGLSQSEIVLSPAPATEMSSTQIREKLSAGEDVSDYLSDEVIEYIKEKGLYL